MFRASHATILLIKKFTFAYQRPNTGRKTVLTLQLTRPHLWLQIIMATEDERYRQSSQYRLWSFSPLQLGDLRSRTNDLAQQQIAPRLAQDPAPDFLTADEEFQLVKFFTVELIRAAQFCELPTEIRATAAIFLRRFYVTNSVMTYPPTDLLKTSLFFGCKAEGFFYKLHKFAEKFPKTTGEQIIAGEFLLCQGIRFAFDVRHPFRALEGAILELRRVLPDEEARINKAHARAREVLKYSPMVTDVYFHYSPSQIMMASLSLVDHGLVEILVPKAPPAGDRAHELAGAFSEMRGKILDAIEGCRKMLEEEPPERMTDYWGLVGYSVKLTLHLANTLQPETVKSMRPLLRKLQKCRDPDRANLVNLQRARREQALKKEKKPATQDDGVVFGEGGDRDAKRVKLEKADDMFGPAL